MENPKEWWQQYKKKVANTYRQHAKLRTQEIRLEQERLEHMLEQTENNLLLSPHNTRLRNLFQNAKNDFKTFFLTKTKEKMVKERYNNFGTNYFRTKEFFRKYKESQKDSNIVSLIDDDGRTHTSHEGILNTAKIFMTNYTEKVQLIGENKKNS